MYIHNSGQEKNNLFLIIYFFKIEAVTWPFFPNIFPDISDFMCFFKFPTKNTIEMLRHGFFRYNVHGDEKQKYFLAFSIKHFVEGKMFLLIIPQFRTIICSTDSSRVILGKSVISQTTFNLISPVNHKGLS